MSEKIKDEKLDAYLEAFNKNSGIVLWGETAIKDMKFNSIAIENKDKDADIEAVTEDLTKAIWNINKKHNDVLRKTNLGNHLTSMFRYIKNYENPNIEEDKKEIELSKEGNMYKDAIKRWNVFVGCYFGCVYCIKSFQAQMKRQKPKYDEKGNLIRGCQDCYDYIPHFHKNRLKDKLPRTQGDEFIWCCSSSDIYFAKREWIEMILERVRKDSKRTFFFQSKAPSVFKKYDFPNNVLLGITLETNRPYQNLSKAPTPEIRYKDFLNLDHSRKVVTIEPLMQFDLFEFVMMIKNLSPERIYIGYDSKKSNLNEPSLVKTYKLMKILKIHLPYTKIKTKLIRKKVLLK